MPQQLRLAGCPAPLDAFHQAVQRPDIVRMLATARNTVSQPQVLAIDGLGFVETALLGQKRSQRVARPSSSQGLPMGVLSVTVLR